MVTSKPHGLNLWLQMYARLLTAKKKNLDKLGIEVTLNSTQAFVHGNYITLKFMALQWLLRPLCMGNISQLKYMALQWLQMAMHN
jgi:hypothetical protein